MTSAEIKSFNLTHLKYIVEPTSGALELTFTTEIFHVSMKFHSLGRFQGLKLEESFYLPAPPLEPSAEWNTAAAKLSASQLGKV